jgi:pimeloyl-ACP methyl ester carboxylesterase
MTPGRGLGRMIDAIHRARPDVPVHIVAHSLGARVALTALETAPPAVIRRMILMSGAEYRGAAERALSRPAAATPRPQRHQRRERGLRPDVPPRRGTPRPRSTARSRRASPSCRVASTLPSTTPEARRRSRPSATGCARPHPHLPLVGLHAARASSPSTAGCSIPAIRPSPRRSPHALTRTTGASEQGGSAPPLFPASNPALRLQVGQAGHRCRDADRRDSVTGPPPSGFCNRTRLS